jgi:hypothetical protein
MDPEASQYPTIIAVMHHLANGILVFRVEALRIYFAHLEAHTASNQDSPYLIPRPFPISQPVFVPHPCTQSLTFLPQTLTLLKPSILTRQQPLATNRTLSQDILLSPLLEEAALKNSQLGVLLLLLPRAACALNFFALLTVVDYCLETSEHSHLTKLLSILVKSRNAWTLRRRTSLDTTPFY